MRKNDVFGVLKHLSQASIYLDEWKMGYVHRKWFVIGHLAEAESESLEVYPDFAAKIRALRVGITLKDDNPIVEDLIIEFCKISGSDLKDMPNLNETGNIDFKVKTEKKKLLYQDKIKDPNISFRNLGKKYGVSHHTAKEWFEEYKNQLGNSGLDEFESVPEEPCTEKTSAPEKQSIKTD